MTSPEPRQTRTPRNGGTAVDAMDTVTIRMSADEADTFTVLLAEAVEVWQKHAEESHSARLRAMHFRALRNKVVQIREQLPGGYEQLEF